MIEDDCIFVNTIRLNSKEYSILVSKNAKKFKQGKIILSCSDMGERWFSDVYDTAVVDGQGRIANDTHKVYISLFIVYAAKNRVYFEDIINIVGLDNICRDCSDNAVSFYFDSLIRYLEKYGCKFRVIRALRREYIKGASPYKTVNAIKNSSFSLSLMIVLFNKFKKSIKHVVHLFVLRLSRAVSIGRIKKAVTGSFAQANIEQHSSESGCIFWKVTDSSNKDYFAKCETRYGFPLENEYAITIQLNNANVQSLFLLPDYEKSTPEIMVYPYIKHETLGELAESGRLTQNESVLLIDFFKKTLKCLTENRIVHRDITLNNLIIIREGGNISAFRLADFGVAVMNETIPSNKEMDRINYTCGSAYRYSYTTWNDSYSCLMILLSVCDKGFLRNNISECLDLLKDYGISWTPKVQYIP